MAKNVPKTTANTENNVYNQHKTTTCRITDEDEKNEKELEGLVNDSQDAKI